MKNKIISFVLLFVYALSFAAFAEESTSGKYKSEFEYLSVYGIMSAVDEESMNKNITQEQFRNALSNIVGANEQTMNRIDSFGEVYQHDGEVTLMKAVISLVKLIGYDNLAIQYGGTNSGYMKVAGENDLLNGLGGVSDNAPITYAQAGKLIYNTLNAPLVILKFENGNPVYVFDDDKTLITENLSVYKVTGTVTATKDYALPGYEKMNTGLIMINDEEYQIAQTNMSEYFGAYITAYYQYDEDEETSKIIKIENKYENSILELSANEIDSFDKSGYYNYTEEETEREKTAKLEQDAKYYYNYKFVNSKEQLEKVDFTPETGSVKLIDSDRNGFYDIVIILDYEVRVVELAESETIYSKFNEGMTEVTLNTIIRDASGAEFADASVISEYDVLHVIYEEGTQKAEYIFVQTNSAEGKISGFNVDGENNILLDNDEEYKVPPAKMDLVKNLSLNMNVILYLDMNNNFAGYKVIQSDDWNFGYLIDIKNYDSDETGEAVLEVKMYDINEQKIVKRMCRSSVKAEGTTYKQAAYSLLIDDCGLYEYMPDGTKRTWDQLFRYKMNADGRITEMDFAPNATDFSAQLTPIWDTRETGLYKVAGSMSNAASNDDATIAQARDKTRSRLPYWTANFPIYHKRVIYKSDNFSTNTWHTELYIKNDTLALQVPSDRNNEEGYRVSVAGVKRDAQTVLDAFTIAEESKSPTIVVFYDGDGAPTESGGGGVVNNTGMIDTKTPAQIIIDIQYTYLEEQDMPTHKITFCGRDGVTTLYMKNEDWVDTLGLKEGSLAVFAHSNGFVDAIQVLADVSQFKNYNDPNFRTMTKEVFGDRGQIVGYAYEKRDDLNLMMIDPVNIDNLSASNFGVMAIDTSVPIYEYDAKTGEMEKADANCIKWYKNTYDLEKTSIIYAGYQNADSQYVFVINNLFE